MDSNLAGGRADVLEAGSGSGLCKSLLQSLHAQAQTLLADVIATSRGLRLSLAGVGLVFVRWPLEFIQQHPVETTAACELSWTFWNSF